MFFFKIYIANVTQRTFEIVQKNRDHANIIGERGEPHTYRTAAKNLRHIYIYIYIYRISGNFRAKNFSCVKFSWCLIFVVWAIHEN